MSSNTLDPSKGSNGMGDGALEGYGATRPSWKSRVPKSSNGDEEWVGESPKRLEWPCSLAARKNPAGLCAANGEILEPELVSREVWSLSSSNSCSCSSAGKGKEVVRLVARGFATAAESLAAEATAAEVEAVAGMAGVGGRKRGKGCESERRMKSSDE